MLPMRDAEPRLTMPPRFETPWEIDMTSRNVTGRYGSLLIALHWFTLALIIAVYACMELRELYPKGSALREGLKTWHFMLGLSVFALVWLRLLARLSGPAPAIVPRPPRWQLVVSHTVQLAIYAFMIAMPLLGWLILSGEGKPVPFFGLELPHLIGENHGLAERLEGIHVQLGNAGYALIGIHALAALMHHYVQKDNTLRRMLPGQ